MQLLVSVRDISIRQARPMSYRLSDNRKDKLKWAVRALITSYLNDNVERSPL